MSKWVDIECEACGKQTQRLANASMVHAMCPKRGRGAPPKYVEVKGEN